MITNLIINFSLTEPTKEPVRHWWVDFVLWTPNLPQYNESLKTRGVSRHELLNYP